MDVTRLHTLGWHHSTSLEQGIRQVWESMKPQLTA
jgi:GDP-L-fucose synthase